MRTLAAAAAAACIGEYDGRYQAYPYPLNAWQHVTCGVCEKQPCADCKAVDKFLTVSKGFTVIFVISRSPWGTFKDAFAIEGDVNTADWGKTNQFYFTFRNVVKYDARGLKLTGRCNGRKYLTMKDTGCMAECPDGQVKLVTLVRYVVEGRFTKRAIVGCDADEDIATHLLDPLRDHEAVKGFLISIPQGPLRERASDDSATIASPTTTADRAQRLVESAQRRVARSSAIASRVLVECENVLPQPLQAARHE